MRDRRARCAFLALILALPPLIGGSVHAGPLWAGGTISAGFRPGSMPLLAAPAALPLLCQVELLIVAGLMYAAMQRRRLLARGLGTADRA